MKVRLSPFHSFRFWLLRMACPCPGQSQRAAQKLHGETHRHSASTCPEKESVLSRLVLGRNPDLLPRQLVQNSVRPDHPDHHLQWPKLLEMDLVVTCQEEPAPCDGTGATYHRLLSGSRHHLLQNLPACPSLGGLRRHQLRRRLGPKSRMPTSPSHEGKRQARGFFLNRMVWRAFLFRLRHALQLACFFILSRMKLAKKGDETLGGMCAGRTNAFAMCTCFAGRFVGAHMRCEAASRKKRVWVFPAVLAKVLRRFQVSMADCCTGKFMREGQNEAPLRLTRYRSNG